VLLAAAASAIAVRPSLVGLGSRRRYHGTAGSRLVAFSLRSRLMRRTLHELTVVPPGGAAGRPLLVLLHGRGMKPSGLLSDAFFRALRRLGARAPDVLLADGGDHSYFHDRRDGAWGSAVVEEAIPAALARLHADRRRVAIGGVSMGGFGALDLARLHPGRFCAIGAHSPALSSGAGATAPGAFDDAADFARHDVVAAARCGLGYSTIRPSGSTSGATIRSAARTRSSRVRCAGRSCSTFGPAATERATGTHTCRRTSPSTAARSRDASAGLLALPTPRSAGGAAACAGSTPSARHRPVLALGPAPKRPAAARCP
jgi:enterochelin esterase-like enzyme